MFEHVLISFSSLKFCLINWIVDTIIAHNLLLFARFRINMDLDIDKSNIKMWINLRWKEWLFFVHFASTKDKVTKKCKNWVNQTVAQYLCWLAAPKYQNQKKTKKTIRLLTNNNQRLSQFHNFIEFGDSTREKIVLSAHRPQFANIWDRVLISTITFRKWEYAYAKVKRLTIYPITYHKVVDTVQIMDEHMEGTWSDAMNRCPKRSIDWSKKRLKW